MFGFPDSCLKCHFYFWVGVFGTCVTAFGTLYIHIYVYIFLQRYTYIYIFLMLPLKVFKITARTR